MRGFIKTLIAFIYITLALFIQTSDMFACDYINKNIPQQYYISALKSETQLINSKKEESNDFVGKQNNFEILNVSNKNNNFGLSVFGKTNIYNIFDNYIALNEVYLNCISHKQSLNLKNTIYTRAP